jgi:hypothetical protein
MLFKEIIAVYTENHTGHRNKKKKGYWLLNQLLRDLQLVFKGLAL